MLRIEVQPQTASINFAGSVTIPGYGVESQSVPGIQKK